MKQQAVHKIKLAKPGPEHLLFLSLVRSIAVINYLYFSNTAGKKGLVMQQECRALFRWPGRKGKAAVCRPLSCGLRHIAALRLD